MLKHLIFYNLLIWGLYFNHNYVHQKDYSKFDMSNIEAKLDSLKVRNICLDSDPEFKSMFNNGFRFDGKNCLKIKIQKHDQDQTQFNVTKE